VPIRPPRAGAWGKPFLNIPVFEPPAIDVLPIDGIAHINLDLALQYLVGDRLTMSDPPTPRSRRRDA